MTHISWVLSAWLALFSVLEEGRSKKLWRLEIKTFQEASGRWGRRRSAEVVAFHLCAPALSLPLGALFLYPLPTCTPWASRNQASTVVLSQSFAEAPCPGLHAYLGIKPQMPTDTSQVSLGQKKDIVGNWCSGVQRTALLPVHLNRTPAAALGVRWY